MKKIAIGLISTYFLSGLFCYIFQDQIIFHEKILPKNYKYSFQVPHKEIWLNSHNNLNINALYFYSNANKRKGIICYFHGNADNLVRWGKFAIDFTKNGYDVFMIDYRGFGKSKGEFSEIGLMNDAEAAYNYCKSQFPENNIVVYGRSLGSGIATQIAAKHNPKMLLLETPYFNFPDVAWHFLPIYPYSKMSRYKFSTDQYITKVNCPIHLFHGTADELVYYESSLKLCKIMGKKPEVILTTILGGTHKNLTVYPLYHIKLDSCLALN